MKKIIAILSVFLPVISYAQVGRGGSPYSFEHFKSLKSEQDVEQKIMPPFDLEEYLQQENARYATPKARPVLFGYPYFVDFSITNSGTWEEINPSTSLWRLKVKCPEALHINLQFTKFNLHEGSKLYVYNTDKSVFLGSFNHLDNKKTGKFSTTIIKGDEVTIEFIQPKANQALDLLTLGRIVHGFRPLGKSADFGTSGSCNNNVVCPEGDPWVDEISAAGMIINGGSRWCSGSMVNNVRQDGTPYFLTANHCVVDWQDNQEDVSDWVYMYNYQSPNCSGSIDGPTDQIVQGSQIVARYEPSDFALILLDEAPAMEFNVFYAGWYAKDTVADSVVSIHHPDGDVKKISFDYDFVSSDTYGSTPNTHWRISVWDDGTTEPGSSGSPLYNKKHRIIGQLHGGTASCDLPNDPDYYGKLAYSWKTASASNQRLKDWLDPDSTNTIDLEGRYFSTPKDSLDAAMKAINTPSSICGKTIQPQIELKNFGGFNLTKATVFYSLDGIVKSIEWMGDLKFLQQAKVLLPEMNITEGLHSLKVWISNPNDSIDQNNMNDTLVRTFSSLDGNNVNFEFYSDYFGYQSKVWISDSTGKTLFFKGGFDNLTLYSQDFCWPDGCYKIRVTDSNKDGICCDNGDGYFNLNYNSETVASGSEFTDTVWINFCIENGQYLSSSELQKHNIGIYPNPANDFVNVTNLPQNVKKVSLFDVSGSKLKEMEVKTPNLQLSVSEIPNGIYFLRFEGNNYNFVEKLIILK